MTLLRKATPQRLSAFSDGVFAVLITVLVLELRPPKLPIFEPLLPIWPTWLRYAVSYLFIAIEPSVKLRWSDLRPSWPIPNRRF